MAPTIATTTINPATTAAATAPELDQTINAALAELDQSVTEAKLHDDPLRLPLMALASFLRAQKQLHAGMVDTIEAAASRQPAAVFNDKQVNDIGRRLHTYRALGSLAIVIEVR